MENEWLYNWCGLWRKGLAWQTEVVVYLLAAPLV